MYRLARDAAAAAAAKEAEANRLRPNDEEHTRALGPLETEHARISKYGPRRPLMNASEPFQACMPMNTGAPDIPLHLF